MLVRILKLVAINVGVLCLLLGLVELVLHVVPPFDRLTTYRQAGRHRRNAGPNRTFEFTGIIPGRISPFKVTVRTNSEGFHDREYDRAKPAGVRRIVVLGDSQVESLQVPLERSFHEIVERRLRADGAAVDVIAFGRSGDGPAQASKLYQEHGRRYGPDLVVWSFTFPNDISDAFPKLKQLARASKVRSLRTIPGWLEASKLATLLWTRDWGGGGSTNEAPLRQHVFSGTFSELNRVRNWDHIVYVDPWPPLLDQAWSAFRKQFIELQEAVSSDGLELIVISTAGAWPEHLSRRYELEDLRWDFRKPDRVVGELCASRGVRWIPSDAVFSAHRSRDDAPIIFAHDGHLNDRGHELVADALLAELARHLPSGASH